MQTYIHFKIVLSLVALALAIWSVFFPNLLQALRKIFLLIICLFAVYAYTNLGNFHGQSGLTHHHDFFHYYMGSKYHQEVGYSDFYECLAAGIVSIRPEAPKKITIRNLKTYKLYDVSAQNFIKKCSSKFSDYRWAQYLNDIEWFITKLNGSRILRALKDHGYNATPIWTKIWTNLSNLISVDVFFRATFLIDFIFFILSAVLVLLTLGAENLLFWLLIIFLMPFSSYQWVGGGLARWDWFFFLHLYFYFLFKSKHTLSLLSLTFATGLRLFPVIWFINFIRPKNYIITFLILVTCLLLTFWFTPIQGWQEYYQHISGFSSNKASNVISITNMLRAYPSINQTLFRILIYIWIFIIIIYSMIYNRDRLAFCIPSLLLMTQLSNYYYVFLGIFIFFNKDYKKINLLILLLISFAWLAKDPHSSSLPDSAYWTILLLIFYTLIAFSNNKIFTPIFTGKIKN